MRDILLKKRVNLLAVLAVIVITAGIAVPVTALRTENKASEQQSKETTSQPAEKIDEKDWETRYNEATVDAMTIEEEEILPVLAVTKDEDLIRWNDEGKVLMVTFSRHPESYPEGKSAVMDDGEVWVTSLPEMEAWFADNYGKDKNEDDWAGRFETLLGMPADGKHTHFSAVWADVKDLTRPAYNPDVEDDEVLTAFSEDDPVDEDFKSWFDGNIVGSYFEWQYPWTRLGYTYDYADNGVEYGLSEFLINADSKVDVEFTYTVDEMVEYLQKQVK